MSFYHSYRILLNLPAKIQADLFDTRTKEQRFRSVFDTVENKKKVPFIDWGTQNYIYHFKTINDNIIIWQLAKQQEYEKPFAGDERIERVTDMQHPFIYLIFHLTKQIVLIQHNSSVFQKLDSTKAKLERYFTQELQGGAITVSLQEISDQREFWSQVEEMDMIQDVTFEYKPPNFFKGEKAVDRLVKDVHEETNFQKFKIFIQNKVEGLIFDVGTFSDHISRLSSGAGTYMVTGFKNGVEKVLNSFTVPVKLPIEDIDNVTEKELEKDFNTIDTINKQ